MADCCNWSVGDDKTVKNDVGITKPRLYFCAYNLCQLNLRVVKRAKMSYPFRVDECYILLGTCNKPHNKIGIESMNIKKSYTLFALVSHKVKRFICKKVGIIFVESFYIHHKVSFTFVQWGRCYFYRLFHALYCEGIGF